jgi:solute carrier family 25 uncoupling protein 8/9
MDLVKVRMQGEGRLAPGVAPRYSGVMNAYATIVRQEGVRGLWTGWGPAVLRNSIINATELASYETAKEVSEPAACRAARHSRGTSVAASDSIQSPVLTPPRVPRLRSRPPPQLLLYKVGMQEGLSVHVAAGAAAGLMATILGSPVDVVKTRVMASRKAAADAAAAVVGSAAAAPGAGAAAPAAPQYSGAIDCVVKTLRHEGVRAFYQGVVPQFYRLTGWSIVMFVSFEQLKGAAARALG